MYISIYPGSLKAKLSISFPEDLVWCGGTSHLRNGTAWTCISPKILAPQSCEAQDCSVDRMWFLMICVFVLLFFSADSVQDATCKIPDETATQ